MPDPARAIGDRDSGSLRVLLVGPLDTADGGKTSGGVATHVSDLARRLSALGLDVAVYADNLSAGQPKATAWGVAYPPVTASKAPMAALGIPGGAGALSRALSASSEASGYGVSAASLVGNVLGLRRAIASHRPDVVHYHHAELRPFFGRLADVADAATVITAHSLSAFRDEASPLRALAAENLAAADLVIAVSDDVAGALAEEVPGLSATVIGNGIDVAFFAATPAAGLRTCAGDPLVLYVGWLARHKGVLDLLEAMALVADRLPNATLALVGPEIDLTADDVRREWKLAPDALLVSAPVSQPEVAAWLHAADLLVLPSTIREGQGRVLLEAFAAGTPVVATNVGAVGALLEGGRLGLLVGPAQPAALADAIAETIAHPDATATRVRAAREVVEAHDAPAAAARVAEAYRDALDRRETRRRA